MMGQLHGQMKWEDYAQERDRPNNRFRCIQTGLEAACQHQRMGGLWSPQEREMPGVTGSNSGHLDICKKHDRDYNSAEIGQHISSGVYQQLRGDSVLGPCRSGQKPMNVVSGKENPHHSPTPPRSTEYHSRYGRWWISQTGN